MNASPASAPPKRALLLFAKKSLDAGLAYSADLTRLLNDANQDLEVSDAIFEDLLFSIDENAVQVIDTKNNRPLTDYNVVYFRFWGVAQGLALAAARFCELKHIPFIDSEVLRPGSFNKITQYMNLYKAGVPFPKTLIAPSGQLLQQYAQYGFAFPLILKSVEGTRGQDNYIVQNEDEMRHILERYEHLTFTLQTFLPNKGDYRVLVMGDEVVLVVKRTAAPGSHLNNTSRGAAAELIPVDTLPRSVRDSAVRAAKFFGRQVAGVDMVQCTTDNRWYCFEVNRSPQIEHASFEHEKAAALAAYLRTLVN